MRCLMSLHILICLINLYLYRYIPVSWPTWANTYWRPSDNCENIFLYMNSAAVLWSQFFKLIVFKHFWKLSSSLWKHETTQKTFIIKREHFEGFTFLYITMGIRIYFSVSNFSQTIHWYAKIMWAIAYSEAR